MLVSIVPCFKTMENVINIWCVNKCFNKLISRRKHTIRSINLLCVMWYSNYYNHVNNLTRNIINFIAEVSLKHNTF